MTIERLTSQGKIIAILTSKQTGGEARIYAVGESRGYQTRYQQKTFFYFVALKNHLFGKPIGITRDARRKNIVNFSDVTIIDSDLYAQFLA